LFREETDAASRWVAIIALAACDGALTRRKVGGPFILQLRAARRLGVLVVVPDAAL
jgi:hypothetical protein